MESSQRVLTGAVVALGIMGVLILLQTRTQARQIKVSYVDLQASLDHELSRSPEVGFLPRVEFRSLKVRFDSGLMVEGSGRWFSLGGGDYTLPNVTISARLPMEASAWSVSDGAIIINEVQIMRAFREAFGTVDGRGESEANERGWQDKLSKFIRRLDVFRDEALMSGNWRVVSIQSQPNSLVFFLEN